MYTSSQLRAIKTQLQQRLYALREEIRTELLNSGEQSYIELAGRVHDIEEESVADLLVDLQLTNINRHIDEIRQIDASLMRMAEGRYGICTDCGSDIGIERLQIQPSATRCHRCQTKHERTFAHAGQASL